MNLLFLAGAFPHYLYTLVADQGKFLPPYHGLDVPQANGGAQMPLAIKLALVGRNSITREGVQRILSDIDFPVHWSAARTEDLPIIEQADPWLLLLFADNQNAATDEEAIRELNNRYPSARIVLLGSEFDVARTRAQ